MELKKYLCFCIVCAALFVMGVLAVLAGILGGIILMVWNMTDMLVCRLDK